MALDLKKDFFNFNLDWFDFYKNFVWEDILIIFFLYNFIKYLIVCTINELIWPTHFFNRKHVSSYQKYRFRTYSEYFSKFFIWHLEKKILFRFLISNNLGFYKSYFARKRVRSYNLWEWSEHRSETIKFEKSKYILSWSEWAWHFNLKK